MQVIPYSSQGRNLVKPPLVPSSQVNPLLIQKVKARTGIPPRRARYHWSYETHRLSCRTPARRACRCSRCPRARQRSPPEKSLPQAGRQRLDLCPPGRDAGSDRVPTRLSARSGNRGRAQGGEGGDHAWLKGLVILPERRGKSSLAA